jgi:isopropylmalate/homocitrate/citramalate synthase
MLMLCSAKALDSFAVDYIEITSPSSSEQALEDSKAIAALGLKVGDIYGSGQQVARLAYH